MLAQGKPGRCDVLQAGCVAGGAQCCARSTGGAAKPRHQPGAPHQARAAGAAGALHGSEGEAACSWLLYPNTCFLLLYCIRRPAMLQDNSFGPRHVVPVPARSDCLAASVSDLFFFWNCRLLLLLRSCRQCLLAAAASSGLSSCLSPLSLTPQQQQPPQTQQRQTPLQDCW